MIEQRYVLALSGIGCVGIGIGTSYGFSSLIGYPYTPMHSMLPFMLLGIGIDDMFVIVQSFDSLKSENRDKDLPTQIGLAIKNAGVAITITSFTNCLAFGIGKYTIAVFLKCIAMVSFFGIHINRGFFLSIVCRFYDNDTSYGILLHLCWLWRTLYIFCYDFIVYCWFFNRPK